MRRIMNECNLLWHTCKAHFITLTVTKMQWWLIETRKVKDSKSDHLISYIVSNDVDINQRRVLAMGRSKAVTRLRKQTIEPI